MQPVCGGLPAEAASASEIANDLWESIFAQLSPPDLQVFSRKGGAPSHSSVLEHGDQQRLRDRASFQLPETGLRDHIKCFTYVETGWLRQCRLTCKAWWSVLQPKWPVILRGFCSNCDGPRRQCMCVHSHGPIQYLRPCHWDGLCNKHNPFQDSLGLNPGFNANATRCKGQYGIECSITDPCKRRGFICTLCDQVTITGSQKSCPMCPEKNTRSEAWLRLCRGGEPRFFPHCQ